MNARTDLAILCQKSAMLRPPLSKASQRFRYAANLIAVDVLSLSAAFVTAAHIRFVGPWPSVSPTVIAAIVPVYVLSAIALRAFSGEVLLSPVRARTRGLLSLAVSAGLLTTLLVLLKVGDTVSRAYLSLGLLFSAIALSVCRDIYARMINKALGGQLFGEVELVDGAHLASTGNLRAIETTSFFDPTAPCPNSLDKLARMVGEADRVIVRCPSERRSAWAHVLQGLNVQAEIVVQEMADIKSLGLGTYCGDATLIVARGPLGMRDRFVKRVFDLAFATTALILLAPLFAVVAIAIKLESKGPVLFKQPRIGRQNKLFYVYKFRSMRSDLADLGGARSTERDDPRITKVGRFIRRTSIDELPQFINVVRGEMSVVGPRPHAVNSTAESLLFWDIDHRYWHRHACKPGITGLAQVRGFRGATLYKQDLTNRVDADLQYLERWSLMRDLHIIFGTIRGLGHENAY